MMKSRYATRSRNGSNWAVTPSRRLPDADAALAAIRRRAPKVVLTDFKMPRKSGMDLMRELQRFEPDIPVVLLTAHGDVPLAVAAMREGPTIFCRSRMCPNTCRQSWRERSSNAG